jgi:myo-inositol 2-dehydrogenase / D-chiro-inositol 1-dehydrogenase
MSDKSAQTTRRDFLKTTAAAGTAFAANLSLLANVHAADNDTIRVGLIGCGGRGSGAADNVLHSAPNVKLVALGDVFDDHLQALRKRITETASSDDEVKKLGNSVDLPDDRCFVGFDAYEKVIQNCDYVMLATPPGFRPIHIAAVVAAGKNLFTEKPVGTDATGIRKVLAAYDEAKKKNLCIVAGTQRRHQAGYLETLKRIHDGAIGDITSGRAYWNQGPIWVHRRQPEWNDMQYMIRNWYHFTWLCGDHIVEQHVHNLDVINWATGQHPIRAVGMGGRQGPSGPEYGESYDHFAVDYEYPNGVHVLSMCRQIAGCADDVSEAVAGTKGSCVFKNGYHITGAEKWDGRDSGVDPYVQEHTDLIAAIRSGKPVNELKQVAESTLTAIMGRMSAYTGKAVTWEKAINSKEDLFPKEVSWDTKMPPLHLAAPGRTPLV